MDRVPQNVRNILILVKMYQNMYFQRAFVVQSVEDQRLKTNLNFK